LRIEGSPFRRITRQVQPKSCPDTAEIGVGTPAPPQRPIRFAEAILFEPARAQPELRGVGGVWRGSAAFRLELLMNRSHVTVGMLAAAGLAAFAPGSAAAQSLKGPYIAVGAGYDDMPDRDLAINGKTVSSQWKAGEGGFAALGYRWSPALRTELELSGRQAKVKTFAGVNPWAGTQWDNSIMANVLYDIDLKGPITPYVGAGLGASWLIWGDNFRATLQQPPTVYDGDSWRAAWQGIVGVSYAVSPRIAVALDGRLKGSFGDYKFPGSVPGKEINHFNQRTRSIFASVRYSFGAGAP
jgi:opacity protein-like surface antigen